MTLAVGCGESGESDPTAPLAEPGTTSGDIVVGAPDSGAQPQDDSGAAPSTDITFAPGGTVCTQAGEVCLTVIIPEALEGTPTKLTVSFFAEIPPASFPDAMGADIADPVVTPGESLVVKSEGVSATGELYALVALYMPGGGPFVPVPGIDWYGYSAVPVNLTGGAVTVTEAIVLIQDEGTNTAPVDPPPNPNPGPVGAATGPIPTFTRVTLFSDLPGAAWLHPVDVNNDGFDELLLSTLSEGVDFASMPPLANGGAYLLRRDGGKPTLDSGVGTWSATKAFNMDDGYGFPNNSHLMDVDNDGIDDWVVAGGFLAKPTGYILWMKGSTSGGEWTFGAPQELPVPDTTRWYHEIHPLDLDGDGDLDFITTNNDSAIQGQEGLVYGTSVLEWYENVGTPGQADFVPHTIANVGGALFTVVDLDADGDEDVVLPQFFGGESLIWMENPGYPMDAWAKHVINNNTGKGFAAEVVDIDNDGKLEIVYGNHNHQASETPEKQVMGLYWWDLPEGDDIYTLENWDSTMHVLYEGFYIATDNPEQDGAPGVFHTGDMDGDGDLDVSVSGDGDKGLYLFVQQEAGVFDQVQLDAGQSMSGDHVMMDLDADGDMDYVWCVFGDQGLSLQSYVYAYIQGEPKEINPEPSPGTPEGTVDPSETGTFGVSQQSATIGAGGDNVPVTLFLPEGAGPFPIVLIVDGFNLGGDMYFSYGQHLASWGYVAVVSDMPSNVFTQPGDEQFSGWISAVVDWLEQNAKDPQTVLAGKADTSRLALVGHSQGGKLSLYFATKDARVKALFALDPVDAIPPMGDAGKYVSVTPELMNLISIPVVYLGETVNSQGTEGLFPTPACAPADNNFQQYYAAATGPALEIEVFGANHFSFLDNPNCFLTCSGCPVGTDDPVTTRALTRAYMTSFFNVNLKGEEAYQAYLTGDAIAADVSAGLVSFQAKNGF